MRTIAHISDLHFGRTSPAVVENLSHAIKDARPDLVAVSGDLTQRARSREFEQAHAFLAKLSQPQIVVPGNHDVPLYNVIARWLWPLARYRHYIGAETGASYIDDEIAVLGINTARALTFKNGRINRRQVLQACACFRPLGKHVIRIVVTHHPFSLPDIETRHRVLGRAKMALTAFAACGVDVVLSGHLHASHAGLNETARAGSPALLVQAGTAASSRTREEPNAFNLLRIEAPFLAVEQHSWTGRTFAVTARKRFERREHGWAVAGPEPVDV